MAANSQVDSDSEQSTSESDLSGHRSSKRLKLGAAVYQTNFNHAWKGIYPFISEVKGDPYKFLSNLFT